MSCGGIYDPFSLHPYRGNNHLHLFNRRDMSEPLRARNGLSTLAGDSRLLDSRPCDSGI